MREDAAASGTTTDFGSTSSSSMLHIVEHRLLFVSSPWRRALAPASTYCTISSLDATTSLPVEVSKASARWGFVVPDTCG